MQPFVFVTVSSAAYARKENSVLTNKTGQSNIFLGCNENYNQNNFKKNGNTLGVIQISDLQSKTNIYLKLRLCYPETAVAIVTHYQKQL